MFPHDRVVQDWESFSEVGCTMGSSGYLGLLRMAAADTCHAYHPLEITEHSHVARVSLSRSSSDTVVLVPWSCHAHLLVLGCRGASKAKPVAQPESVVAAGEEVMKVLRDGLARLQVPCLYLSSLTLYPAPDMFVDSCHQGAVPTGGC